MLRPLLRQIVNRLQDTFQILKNLSVPESDHMDAMIVQESRPLVVSSPYIRITVLPTIQLHGKLCLMAEEIQDKLFKGMLAAKAKTAKLFAPQTMPQQLFRVGHVFPQGTGRFEQRDRDRRRNEKALL
jgi:hypothetical protein